MIWFRGLQCRGRGNVAFTMNDILTIPIIVRNYRPYLIPKTLSWLRLRYTSLSFKSEILLMRKGKSSSRYVIMVAPSTYKKHGCYRNRRKTNCNFTWRASNARLCCADGATNYSLSKTFLRIAMSGLLRIRVVDNIMII